MAKVHVERYRAEAAALGVGYGQPHPVTGNIWSSHAWLKPETFERMRKKDLLRGAASRAKEYGLPFDLDYEWLCQAWPKDGRCPVLRRIVLEWGTKHEKNNSPSIDRIIPELGYVKGNCRIISNRANTLLNNADMDELEAILADAKKHRSAYRRG